MTSDDAEDDCTVMRLPGGFDQPVTWSGFETTDRSALVQVYRHWEANGTALARVQVVAEAGAASR